MPALPALPPWLERALEAEIARWVPHLCGVDAADYRQEALIAWWQASQRYDPARGVPLQAFAWPRMRGRVVDLRRTATTYGHAREHYYWYVPLGRHTAVLPPPGREVWLWRRVNRLPRRQREVIIRHYWSGWTPKQIARHLHLHPSRVHQIHRRAVRALRLMCVLDLLETTL